MAEVDEALERAARAVVDPVLFHSLDELGTLLEVSAAGEGIVVRVGEPLEEYPARGELAARLAVATGKSPEAITLEIVAMDDAARTALAARLRSLEPPSGSAEGASVRTSGFAARASRTRVLAISSGKGGVGKSTVTVNLGVALARAGQRVGLLDADVYGFSVPRMLGIAYPPVLVDKVIVPPVGYGVRCISMGLFVDEDKAVAWRGPMLHKALEQFLVDVHWGELDYLLVDMPPGTGDVALSVGEQLPGAELYVVTTPQPAAQRIAQRAGALGRQLRMPVRGVIENMSYLQVPDGTRLQVFGSGGGELLASSLNVALLASIPLDVAVREGADEGRPAVAVDAEGPVAQAFEQLAAKIISTGPARVYRRELSVS
jgi:ATP-binding protein involved in chromosome partitioning